MTAVHAAGERLATVHQLPNRPRELRHRTHWTEPTHAAAGAHFEWALEQHLAALHAAGVSPYEVLDAFAPDTARAARPLLDELYAAADEVHARVNSPAGGPVGAACDRYDDVLYDLARTLRGAR